jgi:hypothetical protein
MGADDFGGVTCFALVSRHFPSRRPWISYVCLPPITDIGLKARLARPQDLGIFVSLLTHQGGQWLRRKASATTRKPERT